MTKRFPKFHSHTEASCFNCEGDFDGSHPFKSGHAPGSGEFLQCCEKCGKRTWYDLPKAA